MNKGYLFTLFILLTIFIFSCNGKHLHKNQREEVISQRHRLNGQQSARSGASSKIANTQSEKGDFDNEYLENWMKNLMPIIENKTMLDLSIPGTHDSMTWDLSTTVSDGSNDIPPILAWVLHEFHEFAPGHFIRNQSKTQGLNMTEQLNNGIRFIDFRIMYSAPPDHSASSPHDWYCLHFMESNRRALEYLKMARDWLIEHPTEIVVFWFSRHGGPCSTEYPDVTAAEKVKFWQQVEALMQGLMFDRRISQMNETTIKELVQRNHRFIAYVSDVANFTEGSPYAQDGCNIDNQLGDDVTKEVVAYHHMLSVFANASAVKAQDKAQNKFYLQTMAASGPDKQIEDAALIHYLPFEHDKHRRECAAIFNIPNMTDYCPMSLQEISQLTNYYNQITLDAVITQNLHLPNAIYIDAVDEQGTIRTGSGLFPSPSPYVPPSPHNATRFAYVDTFLLYNVRHVCNHPPYPPQETCLQIASILEQRRAMNPLTRWDDPQTGRCLTWPVGSSSRDEDTLVRGTDGRKVVLETMELDINKVKIAN